MITLRFQATSDVVLGPARAFCLHGTVIRQHPHEEIVSQRYSGLWHQRDELGGMTRAASFECHDRLRLQFEDHQGRVSARYGPFGSLSYRDNRIFADAELFAVLSPSHHWEHCASRVRWPILNLLAAGGG